LIEPYFQDEMTTIYCSKCEDVLPQLTSGLVYLTDQPYGTGWVRGGGKVGDFNARYEKEAWDVWSLEWLKLLVDPKRIAAFCPPSKVDELAWALPQPAVMHYRKTNVRPGGIDREPIVVSPPPQAKRWKFEAYNGDMEFHRCQKPLDLMLWLVRELSEAGDIIVDRFMGSGTTLIAAKRFGRRAVGIDEREDYCQIAVQRLSQKELFGIENGHGTLVAGRVLAVQTHN